MSGKYMLTMRTDVSSQFVKFFSVIESLEAFVSRQENHGIQYLRARDTSRNCDLWKIENYKESLPLVHHEYQ